MINEPIRILHVVPNMDAGGLETLIMNLYRNVDHEKIQFDFLLHYKGDFFFSKEIRELGGRIYNLSVRDDHNIFKYICDLRKFFSTHKEYRIVHGHMVSTAVFYLYFAKKNGVPVRIIHSHNTSTNTGIKGSLKRILAGMAPIFANKFFACGKMAGDCLFRGKEFEVINNGIEVDRFALNKSWRNEIRKELCVSNDTKIYGHIGRFNAQKNHDFLIDIFYEISKLQNNCMFVLVGDGELKESIFNKAKTMGVFDKIVYLGIRNDVNKIYQAMDVFILPSLFEGFPVVGTECQAAGLPMLVSDSVSSEVKLVDSLSFMKLTQSPKMWAEKAIEMGEYSRTDTSQEVARAGFDIKNEAKRLTEIYSKSLGMVKE